MAESKAEERISSERSMGTRAEDNTPEGESDKLKMTDGLILDLAANQELQRFQEEGDLEEILTRMERESGISSTNTSKSEEILKIFNKVFITFLIIKNFKVLG